MNNVILVGRLTAAPEPRYTQNGIAYCNFTLAVDRRQAPKDGDKTADFFPCRVWRGLAEACAKYLDKGSLVAVSGELQNRSYEVDDGSRRKITEVIAHEVQFLTHARSADQEQAPMLTDEDMPF